MMTTIMPSKVKCPICETVFDIDLIGSSNRMGSPDLDLRPPEMYRSTMNMWVHQCPNCGYAASDFDKKPEVTRDFIESDFYQSCENIDFESFLAEKFYHQYLIAHHNINKFWALIRCAWACDDRRDTQNAILMRNKALEHMESLDLNDDMMVQKADIMRRSNHFDEVIEEFSDKTFSEDIYNEICAFQVEKARQKDNGRYTVEDAVKD